MHARASCGRHQAAVATKQAQDWLTPARSRCAGSAADLVAPRRVHVHCPRSHRCQRDAAPAVARRGMCRLMPLRRAAAARCGAAPAPPFVRDARLGRTRVVMRDNTSIRANSRAPGRRHAGFWLRARCTAPARTSRIQVSTRRAASHSASPHRCCAALPITSRRASAQSSSRRQRCSNAAAPAWTPSATSRQARKHTRISPRPASRRSRHQLSAV